MSRLTCACALSIAACSSSTTHGWVTMRIAGSEVDTPTLLVLPGTRLTLSGGTETSHQGVFPVSSNSEHPEYGRADLDITCKSPTKAPCNVDGNVVTPLRAGTFEVTAVADGDRANMRRWTVTALDVKRIELEPCGTVAVGVGERSVGVYAVGPQGRLKLAVPAVINGAPGTSVAIAQPATFELQASVAGITGTCRLEVVTTP